MLSEVLFAPFQNEAGGIGPWGNDSIQNEQLFGVNGWCEVPPPPFPPLTHTHIPLALVAWALLEYQNASIVAAAIHWSSISCTYA